MMKPPQTFQQPGMMFKVRYFDPDQNKLIESEVEARNEAHAGKRFKKLHNLLSVCACKFQIREVK